MGSSRSRTSGQATRADARPTRLRYPPERASTGLCRSVIPSLCRTSWHCCSRLQASDSSILWLRTPSSARSTALSGLSATASLSSLKRSSRSRFSPHPANTCSKTVRPGSTLLSWPTSSTLNRDEQRRSPPPSGSSPASTFSKVDFPDPLGPISPRRSPSRMWRVRSANSVRMPKSLDASTRLIRLTRSWPFAGLLDKQIRSYRQRQQRPPFRICVRQEAREERSKSQAC